MRCTRERCETTEVRFFQAKEPGLLPVPVRVEAEAIPCLPPLPWHIADPARFAAECRLLDAAGFKTGIDTTAPGERLGLRLRAQRDGGRPLTAVTGLRHPHDEPVLLDDRGRPVALAKRWTPTRFLVDLVREAPA